MEFSVHLESLDGKSCLLLYFYGFWHWNQPLWCIIWVYSSFYGFIESFTTAFLLIRVTNNRNISKFHELLMNTWHIRFNYYYLIHNKYELSFKGMKNILSSIVNWMIKKDDIMRQQTRNAFIMLYCIVFCPVHH